MSPARQQLGEEGKRVMKGALDERAVRESETSLSCRDRSRRLCGIHWPFALGFWMWLGIVSAAGQIASDRPVQTQFKIKFVTDGIVYIEGGRSAGLAEGQRLTVRRDTPDESGNTNPGTSDIRIVSVASTSAAAEIVSSNLDVRPGDTAYLSAEDTEKLKMLRTTRESRKYPQVITFTEGDPMDEEVREHLPRPPSPEINRLRGQVGFEYNSITEPGSTGMRSSQYGMLFRADMTRIGGSYWNLSGFYRGRFVSQTPSNHQTLNDLINRTYHLSLTYNNPGSHWVAGFGRLYLPWATSLDTIDGGYLGRHYGKFTFGLFGGSAPDPTSWNYAPNRQIGGGFFNIEGGSYDSFRYTTTFGVAVSRVDWHPDRQFGFFESGFYYKRYLSIYHDLETDFVLNSSANQTAPAPANTGLTTSPYNPGLNLSRDYLTIRYQPVRMIAFDATENYFRNIPTFDQRLIATGLLDKVLFQGLSGGVHLDLPWRISPYVDIGKSHGGGDAKDSWNKMYGLTLGNILHTGIRADMRYSQFDSSFGSGIYRTIMLSRQLGESLRFDIQVGQQNFASTLTNESRVRWLTSTVDWFLARHYFLASGITVYRGRDQSYNQFYLDLGYRF